MTLLRNANYYNYCKTFINYACVYMILININNKSQGYRYTVMYANLLTCLLRLLCYRILFITLLGISYYSVTTHNGLFPNYKCYRQV